MKLVMRIVLSLVLFGFTIVAFEKIALADALPPLNFSRSGLPPDKALLKPRRVGPGGCVRYFGRPNFSTAEEISRVSRSGHVYVYSVRTKHKNLIHVARQLREGNCVNFVYQGDYAIGLYKSNITRWFGKPNRITYLNMDGTMSDKIFGFCVYEYDFTEPLLVRDWQTGRFNTDSRLFFLIDDFGRNSWQKSHDRMQYANLPNGRGILVPAGPEDFHKHVLAVSDGTSITLAQYAVAQTVDGGALYTGSFHGPLEIVRESHSFGHPKNMESKNPYTRLYAAFGDLPHPAVDETTEHFIGRLIHVVPDPRGVETLGYLKSHVAGGGGKSYHVSVSGHGIVVDGATKVDQ